MAHGAPCPVGVMAALVGLQKDYTQLSKAITELGLGRCLSLYVAHRAISLAP